MKQQVEENGACGTGRSASRVHQASAGTTGDDNGRLTIVRLANRAGAADNAGHKEMRKEAASDRGRENITRVDNRLDGRNREGGRVIGRVTEKGADSLCLMTRPCSMAFASQEINGSPNGPIATPRME